jgi:hypothetical protein
VAAFGSAPELVCTAVRDIDLVVRRMRFDTGFCRPGDQIVLMTDALAAWFLARRDEGAVAGAMRELAGTGGAGDRAGFTEWVGHQRATKALRNDDVGFLHVDIRG